MFYSYCCCVWVSVAHIFTKSDAGGATPAIPSGVCLRVTLLTCETVLDFVSHCPKDGWIVEAKWVPKTGLQMWDSFYPVYPAVLWG